MRHGIQIVKILNGLTSVSGFLFLFCVCVSFSQFMSILKMFTLCKLKQAVSFFYMTPVDMTMSVRKYCVVNA